MRPEIALLFFYPLERKLSHRLEEVLSLSDRITVLRDGELIDVLDNTEKNVTKDQLVSLMVGRKLEQYYPSREARESDEIVMDVQGLTKEGLYRNVSFQLHKGEILGITGLVGAKRTEVVKSIFGAIHADSGKVMVGGEEVTFSKPSDAMKHLIIERIESKNEIANREVRFTTNIVIGNGTKAL